MGKIVTFVGLAVLAGLIVGVVILGETAAPSGDELRLIRESLDPGGVYTK